MANPDPKALQEAAAKLADQAKASRQAIGAEYTRTITDQRTADDDARVKLATAQTEVKTREDLLKHRQEQLQKEQTNVADTDRRADEAQKAGDTRLATELREEADIARTSATGFSNDIQQAQRELSDARVAVAERQRDVEHSEQRFQEIRDSHNAAEHQLDALENKASMMDEASRKLALASTLDNPVERADAELAAEKLLKDAGAIQVDAGAITKLTGQELQIPDVSALPVADASPTGDATGDPTADTGAGTGSATADGDAAAATADGGASGHLQDEFGTVAADAGAGDTGTATAMPGDATVGADPAGTGTGTGADVTDPAATALDDGSGGTAPDPTGAPDLTAAPDLMAAPDLTAAPDPLGVDPPAPVADAGADATAGFDTGPDGASGSGGDTGSGTAADPGSDVPVTSADAGSDAAPDPMPDPGAATADTFSDFGADPSGSDAGVPVPDDAEV